MYVGSRYLLYKPKKQLTRQHEVICKESN